MNPNLQKRAQKARERSQRLRGKRRNDELAPAQLQQASQERQIIIYRYAARAEEELASTSLRRSGKERKRIIDRDAATNEAQMNDDRLHIAGE